jgi:hypothetical protein
MGSLIAICLLKMAIGKCVDNQLFMFVIANLILSSLKVF